MPEMDQDQSDLMDHMALEAMHAVEAKDKEGFRNAFHVLVADIVGRMSEPTESKEG